MTKQETAKIMAVFHVTYPRYYIGQSEEEKRQALNIWAMMLEEYPYDIVQSAVKAVIATCKYAPSPADVIEKINDIRNADSMLPLEAWSYVRKAISNSTYRAKEEWEQLPEELKKLVTPDLLHSWAETPAGEVETVIQSNFLRSFRNAQAKKKEYACFPKKVQKYIAECKEVKEEKQLELPAEIEKAI